MPPYKPIEQKIAEYVDRSAGPDACWPWIGRSRAEGYGKVGHLGTSYYAHRVAYELVKGPIPDGYQVDHLCRTRICCNPAHLEAVTMRENNRRAIVAKYEERTHCPNGHEYTPDNVKIVGIGVYRPKRRCAICTRAAQADYERRKRSARQAAS